MQKSKGFTIIELLVVVAIIAVLTGIVLVNVTSYINKGKDAAAQGNLATALTDVATYYSTNSNFTGLITSASSPWTGDTTTVAALNALTSAGYTVTTNCNGAGATGNTTCGTAPTTVPTAWCAMVTLKASTNTFCVDSTGNKLTKSGGTCSAGVCS